MSMAIVFFWGKQQRNKETGVIPLRKTQWDHPRRLCWMANRDRFFPFGEHKTQILRVRKPVIGFFTR
jgi:hypothetical protein